MTRRKRPPALSAMLSAEEERRQWLQKQPRAKIPISPYNEFIYVHKRIYDGFMKQAGKRIRIVSVETPRSAGGMLKIEYETRKGGRGTLELVDLGPPATENA